MKCTQAFIEEYEFFTDFDGTITSIDSTEAMINTYGNEAVLIIEERFLAGKVNNRESMVDVYRMMNLTQEMYNNVLHSIKIDPGFAHFCAALKAAGGDITVVTGSAIEGVRNYLHSNGIDDLTIRGNKMEAQDGIIVFYCADEIEDTHCIEADCAQCKSKWLIRAREQGKKVLYIGDGVTDRCAANYTDILFAKHSLARYCEENDIPFIRYNDFYDIYRYLFEKAE